MVLLLLGGEDEGGLKEGVERGYILCTSAGDEKGMKDIVETSIRPTRVPKETRISW